MVIYDQEYLASFHQKIESVQYNSALAITGAIRGASKEKLYLKLGLKPFKKEDSIENCAVSLKYLQTNFQSICSILSYVHETLQYKKC